MTWARPSERLKLIPVLCAKQTREKESTVPVNWRASSEVTNGFGASMMRKHMGWGGGGMNEGGYRTFVWQLAKASYSKVTDNSPGTSQW